MGGGAFKSKDKAGWHCIIDVLGLQAIHVILYIVEIVSVNNYIDYTITQRPYDTQVQKIVDHTRSVLNSWLIIGGTKN